MVITTGWQRFISTKKFAASPAAVTQWLLRFSANQALYVFGAQLAYMPGPGEYQKNGATPGVHATCRFDGDEFMHRATDFSVNATKLAVVEILA